MLSRNKLLFSLFIFYILLLLVPFSTYAKETSDYSSNNKNNNVTQVESLNMLGSYLKTSYLLSDNEYNIQIEKPIYNIDEVKIAKYYLVKTLDGQEYFAIISTKKDIATVFVGGEGTPDILELGKSNLYYFGGYTLINAENSTQIMKYIKSKREDISNDEIKAELDLHKDPNALNYWNELGSYSTLSTVGTGSKTLSHIIFSQKDSDVNASYRNSACGPTTMAVMLQYWHDSRSKGNLKVYLDGYATKGAFINYLYYNRGGSYLGMSVNALRYGLENEIAARGYNAITSTFNNFYSYSTEIQNNRPVAVKFDKWFTLFEPNEVYDYNYHWTPGLGYTSSSSGQFLRVQTLGTKSRIRDINYGVNSPIISMVSLNIY